MALPGARGKRREDRCLILRLWNRATPYIQITGFLITIGTVIFTGGGIWKDVQAYGPRLDTIEQWKYQQAQDTAEMKQSLRDIHEYLLPRKRR